MAVETAAAAAAPCVAAAMAVKVALDDDDDDGDIMVATVWSLTSKGLLTMVTAAGLPTTSDVMLVATCLAGTPGDEVGVGAAIGAGVDAACGEASLLRLVVRGDRPVTRSISCHSGDTQNWDGERLAQIYVSLT